MVWYSVKFHISRRRQKLRFKRRKTDLQVEFERSWKSMELKVPRSSIWQELRERRLSPTVRLSKGKEVDDDDDVRVEVSDRMLALLIRHNWKIHKYIPTSQNRMKYWNAVASWRKTGKQKLQNKLLKEGRIFTKEEWKHMPACKN